MAIIHTSMFFALAHFSPQSLIPLVFISLLLSFLAYSSRSLLPGIVLHFSNNLISVIAYRVSWLHEMDTTQVIPVPVAAALVVGSCGIVFFLLRRLRAADARELS